MLLTNLGASAAARDSSAAGSSAAGATIVADELTRIAAIVNPVDLEQTLDYLQTHQLRLRYIFSTGSKPTSDSAPPPQAYDSLRCRAASGVGCRTELAYRTGAKGYVFHHTQAIESTFALLKPGDVIEFGHIRLKVAKSNSNALSLLLYDLAINDRIPQKQWMESSDIEPADIPCIDGVHLVNTVFT